VRLITNSLRPSSGFQVAPPLGSRTSRQPCLESVSRLATPSRRVPATYSSASLAPVTTEHLLVGATGSSRLPRRKHPRVYLVDQLLNCDRAAAQNCHLSAGGIRLVLGPATRGEGQPDDLRTHYESVALTT
jgi:hypothetical protein